MRFWRSLVYKQRFGRTTLNLKPNEMEVLVCHGQVQDELPIYVPDSTLLAQKIVEEAHVLTLHGGISLTMTQEILDTETETIRQEYTKEMPEL